MLQQSDFNVKPISAGISNILTPMASIDTNLEDNRQQNWEELNGIYNAISEGMVEMLYNIQNMVGIITMAQYKLNDLDIIVKAITRDSKELGEELLSIKAQHEGKTGVIEDGDELVMCLEIFNQYNIFKDRMVSTLFNHTLELSSMCSEIQEMLNKNPQILNNEQPIVS